MSDELKANAALLTEAIDALTSCDDADYRIDMMLAYRPEIVSTLRALLSLLTAVEARAEAAEASLAKVRDTYWQDDEKDVAAAMFHIANNALTRTPKGTPDGR